MPRTVPIEQKEIAAELRSVYGGMMTAADVGTEIGVKHHSAYEAFLIGVPFYVINNRKRYKTSDIAKKIYESRGDR